MMTSGNTNNNDSDNDEEMQDANIFLINNNQLETNLISRKYVSNLFLLLLILYYNFTKIKPCIEKLLEEKKHFFW